MLAIALILVMAVTGGAFMGVIGYSTFQFNRMDRELNYSDAI